VLRLCGARADLLAVLSLPEHYREDAAIAHLEALKPSRFDDSATTKPAAQSSVPALTFGEQAALNYGAAYHPWLEGREAGLEFRRTPPDGAACGVLARRALSRGAWIAPANEPWRGVAALAPELPTGRRLDLQEARINLVRQTPRAFLTLCGDMLSAEPDLRFIHVRRLLILLRRLALKLGATYAFEPNDASFRRLVQRNFEALLEDLFRRGAFAGTTAGSSFQVVTSDELNTPPSIEQGRFIVELRVAPAQPLTFITLRLVQSGAGRLAVVEE
jgi:phage tail sheath protein FI